MKKALIKEAVENTQRLFEYLWNHDESLLDEYFDDDIVFIGPNIQQFCHLKERAIPAIKDLHTTIVSGKLSNVEIYPVANELHTLVLSGRFLASKTYVLRVTVVWSFHVDKGLKIIHLHLSYPESTPHQLMQEIERQDQPKEMISVKNNHKQMNLINKYDIEYAKALGHDTLICMNNKEVIHAKMSWQDTLKILDDNKFLQVHRSYIIQKGCVKVIGKNYLEMHSGDRVPVPVKNMKQVFSVLVENGLD